jgi:hypothetical protein
LCGGAGTGRGEAKVQTRGLSPVLGDPLAAAIFVTMSGLSGGDAFGFDCAMAPGVQRESLERWASWAKAYAPEAK